MNQPNMFLQDDGFVLQDVSVENPKPLLLNSFASALGLSVLLRHVKATMLPLENYSGYVNELISLNRAPHDSAQIESAVRKACMSISHRIDIQISFRNELLYMLSVTAAGIVNIDKAFSEKENRYHAASLLVPGMRTVINNFLQMSGVSLNMETDPTVLHFFTPENLKKELAKWDEHLNTQESIVANDNFRRV